MSASALVASPRANWQAARLLRLTATSYRSAGLSTSSARVVDAMIPRRLRCGTTSLDWPALAATQTKQLHSLPGQSTSTSVGVVVVTLEAAEVTEFRERPHPIAAACCDAFEDVDRASSCCGRVVEVSEMLMTGGEGVECCGRFPAVAARAVEVSGCLFGVSQGVVGRPDEAWPTASRCWYRPHSRAATEITDPEASVGARSAFNGCAASVRCDCSGQCRRWLGRR
jgi:hypothetical protein